MRRNKLCKRVLSVTLATVLALGSPIAMGPSGAVGPTTAKAAETDIEDGLVAYYKFEGNLDNSVPDGAPAKLHVGGISEAWVSGSTGEEAYGDDTDGRGKAYSFTGSKEDGTRGDGLELGVKTSENFSISLWVNASEKINFQPIFFTNIDLVNYITAGTYYNNYASGGIVDYKGVLHYLDKNNSCESNLTDLKENEWTHVALTFNNSGKATLYYNGGILSTRTISDYDGSLKNMPIYLGVNLWDPSFKGLMDEVRVYDRELTQAEVIALAGKPQTTKITLTPNEETVTNTAYYVGDDARQ